METQLRLLKAEIGKVEIQFNEARKSMIEATRNAASTRTTPEVCATTPTTPSVAPPTTASTSAQTTPFSTPFSENATTSAPPTAVTTPINEMEQLVTLQTRMFAFTHLQNSRPKTKFSGGRKVDFSKQMKLFTNAVDAPGVTPRQKLQEFQYYFDGAAYQLIEADTLRDDAEAAVEAATTRLTKTFGTRRETAKEMLEEILQGKVVQARDPSTLLDFYAKLLSVYTLAEETGRAADFETPTTIDSILKRKVPFLADKWCKKAVKHFSLHETELNFREFLEFINDERSLSERYVRAMGGAVGAAPANSKLPGAKIAATSASTSKSGGSASATDCCPQCGASHRLVDCEAFKKAPAEEKRKICFSARTCYKCLEQGHVAKFCKTDARCETCLRQHLTLMHDANAPPAPQASAAGANPTTTA